MHGKIIKLYKDIVHYTKTTYKTSYYQGKQLNLDNIYVEEINKSLPLILKELKIS